MTHAEISQPEAMRRDPRALALLLAASLTVMAAATISPALPGLARQFPDTPGNAFLIRLLVPAPSLAVVLTAALCGILADRLRRKPLLLGGVALFAVAGSAGLVLEDLTLLLASRLILGIALAMIMTAQSALIGDYYTGAALHALSGAQVAARNFGGFAFITMAGVLAGIATRLPFAIYALPALALPFFARVLTEPARPGRQGKVAGVAGDAPDWHLPVALLALGQCLVTMLFFTMPTQLPFYLQCRGYQAPGVTGGALGALMIAGGFAALLYPRIRSAIGDFGGWGLGFTLQATGFAMLTSSGDAQRIFVGTALVGAGYALSMPGFIALSLSITPAPGRAKTAALLTGSVFLGQFLSPFTSIPAIGIWGWQASGTGLAIGLGIASLISVIAALRRGRV